jgi:hypothetical protein
MATAAAEYLAAGLQVIALIGKMPNTRWHPRGLLDALSGAPEGEADFAELERRFAEPTTGIGLLIPDGMLVADVDSEDAARVFMGLVGGELPETPTAQTANGLHIWLWSGRASGSVWFEGRTLLLRGSGSYVAAPPSVHPSGAVYEWLLPLISESGVLLAPEPVSPAIDEVLRLRTAAVSARAELQPEREKGTIAVTFDPLTFVWEQNITGLVRAVEQAAEGNRNNVLAWAAMSAAEDGVDLADALPQFLEAARKAGLDDREARVTIKAAFGRVARRG